MRNNILWVAMVVGLVGCAQSFQQVPGEQWKTVPVEQRTALDHQCDADAVAANAELAAARAAASSAKSAVTAPPTKVQATAAVTSDGSWGAAIAAHEKQKSALATDIESAQVDARAAQVAWVKARLAAATLHVEVVRAERELVRAKAVDHNLLGTDTYADLGQFQGQLARVQGQWYALVGNVKAARETLARANAKVAASKERYAALVRTGPAAPDDGSAPAAEQRLVLAHWFVPRAPMHHAQTANLQPVLAQVGPVGGSGKYKLETRFRK